MTISLRAGAVVVQRDPAAVNADSVIEAGFSVFEAGLLRDRLDRNHRSRR